MPAACWRSRRVSRSAGRGCGPGRLGCVCPHWCLASSVSEVPSGPSCTEGPRAEGGQWGGRHTQVPCELGPLSCPDVKPGPGRHRPGHWAGPGSGSGGEPGGPLAWAAAYVCQPLSLQGQPLVFVSATDSLVPGCAGHVGVLVQGRGWRVRELWPRSQASCAPARCSAVCP